MLKENIKINGVCRQPAEMYQKLYITKCSGGWHLAFRWFILRALKKQEWFEVARK